mgnify:CR=1 FL=1|tara:strand:- start:71 stop:448 length:378 start_codon:yes stop_codon:yes gene_type:complete
MKTIETVYNKLNNAKTELATHKVELGLIDDFEDEFNKSMQLQSKAMASTTVIDNAARKALKLYDDAGKNFLKANARYQEIENISKELGVDVSSKVKNMKKALSESLKEIDNASRNLLKVQKIDFV